MSNINNMRQAIYNVQNHMAGIMPCKPFCDDEIIVKAYEAILENVKDTETRGLLFDVTRRLRVMNDRANKIVDCWTKSSEHLRTALQELTKDERLE